MEDFVTFGLARKLQQKGFPLKKVYHQDGSPLFYDLPQDHPDWSQCDAWYIPTIWEVLKWLREKKHIAINITFIPVCWQFAVLPMSFNKNRFKLSGKTFYFSYEQASLAGIEYVLDNLV